MSGSRSLHARGFTLIELLVVVAAVAVLIALLLPSMAKVREHAKQVICTGNLRQNAVAMSAYLHDSNDWLPTIWSSAWDGPPVAIEGGYAYNQGLLYPYLNDNAATLFCPDVVSGMSTTWKMFTDPKLTRFNGGALVTFDQPRRVKLSPAEWKDGWLNPGAMARNVMIDLLESADKPATIKGEKKIAYRIEPTTK